jgi:hypothetical protein
MENIVNTLGAIVLVYLSWILVRKIVVLIFRSNIIISVTLGQKLGHTSQIWKNLIDKSEATV